METRDSHIQDHFYKTLIDKVEISGIIISNSLDLDARSAYVEIVMAHYS